MKQSSGHQKANKAVGSQISRRCECTAQAMGPGIQRERVGHQIHYNQWSARLHPRAERLLTEHIKYVECSQVNKDISQCIHHRSRPYLPLRATIQPFSKVMHSKYVFKEPSSSDAAISARKDRIATL